MKTRVLFSTVGLLPVSLALTLTFTASASAEEVKLKLKGKGAMSDLGGYMPSRLTLSETKPESLKKVPENLTAPLYGELKFGAKESPASIAVVLDEPDGKPSRIWVDSNGNGDVTDDPAAEWKGKTSKANGGRELTMYMGSTVVKLGTGAEAEEVTIDIYRFDKTDPTREALKSNLFYYGDYDRSGKITLGDKTYDVILSDGFTTGDFRGEKDGKGKAVQLFVDLNGDGKFDRGREAFDVNKPFNIGGTTYEIQDMSSTGASFKIEKSSQTVAETKPAPSLANGKPALAFEAKVTGGEGVKFPAEYKGKLVMLDFWATWCGPCRGEIPGLVAAYKKYHEKGFEVLGISLDKEKQEENLARFTKENGMSWPQVYDGKFWTAKVAVDYNIQSIPAAFLVDGDTGIILASSQSLRGEQLEGTLSDALKKKNAK